MNAALLSEKHSELLGMHHRAQKLPPGDGIDALAVFVTPPR